MAIIYIFLKISRKKKTEIKNWDLQKKLELWILFFIYKMKKEMKIIIDKKGQLNITQVLV